MSKDKLTGAAALARMIELTEAIARCQRMQIVEIIPDLEAEREYLKKEWIRTVKSAESVE